MTRRGRRRMAVIGVSALVFSSALGLALVSMRGTIVFFQAPSDVAAKAVAPGTRFRLGGLVDQGSVRRGPDQAVEFAVSDGRATVPVRYRGLLPDLFREGQGVVTEGALTEAGVFVAESVLARHDETYMPREVADALKAQGRWQGGNPQVVAQP